MLKIGVIKVYVAKKSGRARRVRKSMVAFLKNLDPHSWLLKAKFLAKHSI